MVIVSSGHGEASSAAVRAATGVRRVWGLPWVQLPVQLAAMGLAAVLINHIALAAASGAVRVGPGPTFDTEFIDVPWWFANLVLCIPVWAFGRRWWRLAPCVLALAVVAVPPFWAFGVMVDRYAASGWSQGLEYLGIIFPVFFGVLFMLTLALASMSSPRRQALEQGRREAAHSH
jgi:hypothetical protein